MPTTRPNTAQEVKGTPYAAGSPFRKSALSIGRRLAVCFLLIVVSMLAADAVAFWQFRQTVAPSQRLNNADQASLAVVRLQLDVDAFRDKVAALESSHDTDQFSTEAAGLRQSLLEDVADAQRTLRTASEIAREDPTIPAALETLGVTLPSQLDTAVQLAAAGDWTAVRLRLQTQIQDLIDLSSSLVQKVDRQVQRERAKAIEDAETAQRRLFVVIPVVGLLTVLVAVALGWYTTQSITVPLAELGSGAQALARGDFRREVNVGGNDELAVVGRAFNHAARQLEDLYEELRNSEEQWRAAFESNPTMYFIIDEPGNIVTVNTFGAEHLGYGIDELIEQPVLNVFYEPDREAVQKHAQECFRQPGQTMRWEAREIRKDGTMLWVRETANAVSLKNRPVLLVVCEDITEQKRAEEAARRSESELRALIENVPAMVFIALPGPSNAFISRGWREYTGQSAEDTAGSGWQAAVHPDDLERHIAKWRVCSATGEPFEDEARFRRATDGEYRWFLVRAVPLRDEVGNILKWYGVLTDIEDRKRAEEKIRQSEGELRQLIDVIPQQVFVFDADWSPLFANRRELEYTGLTSQEVRSKEAVARIVHPEDLKKLEAARGRALSDGAPIEMEARIRGKDGGYRWFLIRDNPLRDEQGRVLRWYGTRTDIEDRKRAEEASRKAQADLAHVARVVTMGELVASIAHEVNQPLTGVVVHASTCLRWLSAEPPDLEEARQGLKLIVRDGKRAGEVITRLRALVKKVPPRRERLDINTAILEVIALTHGELQRNRVELRTQLSRDLPLVRADRVQLQQVILNLIVNATEAMSGVGDRPRELVVGTGATDSSEVFVEVRDSGPGLDEASLHRLFDSFYTTKPEGMGMGLSISRSIIEAHGGRLWATPNQPQGAVFRFTLPIEGDGTS